MSAIWSLSGESGRGADIGERPLLTLNGHPARPTGFAEKLPPSDHAIRPTTGAGYQAEVFSVVCLGTIVADMSLYKPRNKSHVPVLMHAGLKFASAVVATY